MEDLDKKIKKYQKISQTSLLEILDIPMVSKIKEEEDVRKAKEEQNKRKA